MKKFKNYSKLCGVLAIAIILFSAAVSNAKDNKKHHTVGTNAAIVKQFYAVMNPANVKNINQMADKVLANDWQDYNSNDHYVGKTEALKMIQGYYQQVPNLTMKVQHIISNGNKIIVRGEMTGTPKAGTFLGVKTDGTKSFKIMSIDIHMLKDGKIFKTYHLENWLQAMSQVKSGN